MVEFALVLPVLLLIIVGMLGFGRVLYYWISVNHLANEGARWAAVDCSPSVSGCGTGAGNLQQYIYDNASTSELQNGLKVCITPPGVVGDPVVVRVEKSFTFLPIMNQLPVNIRGAATMKTEFFRGAGGTAPTYLASNDKGPCT